MLQSAIIYGIIIKNITFCLKGSVKGFEKAIKTRIY